MPTDITATVHAERTIRELLDQEELIHDGCGDAFVDAETAARKVAGAHQAHFERRDGQRRVVLTGEWEVDPAAHVAA